MQQCWFRILVLGMIVFALMLTTQTKAQSPQIEPFIVRIHAPTFEQRQAVSNSGVDLLEMRDGDDLFALVSESERQTLINQGFEVQLDRGRTQALRRQRSESVHGYRTVEEGYTHLATWQAQYPNLAHVFTYGQSWDKASPNPLVGYDLKGITLTNRLIAGDKPTFMLIAGIHGREMPPPELALRFIEYLLVNYHTNADVHWLLDYHQVVVVPFANPDGRKLAEGGLSQRKNRNTDATPNCFGDDIGVDLNRNSSFRWGGVGASTNPCNQTFRGLSAASEPEVSSLQRWIRGIYPDRRGANDSNPAPDDTSGVFITLHSFSNLVLWPYGHTSAQAPNAADLRGLGTKFASYNGYIPEQSVDLYPTTGATDDWTYGELGIASYTFEVGTDDYGETCYGFYPPFECLDQQIGNDGNSWGRNLPAFLYAAKVARTPYMTQRGPDALNLSISNELILTATISDGLNGGQSIATAEAYLDIPPWHAGATPITLNAVDGVFDSVAENVTVNLARPSAGRHMIYVRGRDSAGNWGAVSAIWLGALQQTYVPLILQ